MGAGRSRRWGFLAVLAALTVAGCGTEKAAPMAATATSTVPSAQVATVPPVLDASTPGHGYTPADDHPVVTYDTGNMRLALPRDGYTPKVSGVQAWDAYLALGMFGTSKDHVADASIRLGSATQASGPHAGQQDVPVWIIAFPHIPGVGSGGAVTSGATHPPPLVVIQSVIVLVSSDTGSVMLADDSVPDPSPMTPPPPTTAK